MCIFKSDNELVKHPIQEDGVILETVNVCPNCLTDSYLMDIQESEDWYEYKNNNVREWRVDDKEEASGHTITNHDWLGILIKY